MNSAQNTGLVRLLLRWPEGRAAVSPECVESSVFCEVCTAYEEACLAREFWQQYLDPVALTRAAEYERLALALETEARVFATAVANRRL